MLDFVGEAKEGLPARLVPPAVVASAFAWASISLGEACCSTVGEMRRLLGADSSIA